MPFLFAVLALPFAFGSDAAAEAKSIDRSESLAPAAVEAQETGLLPRLAAKPAFLEGTFPEQACPKGTRPMSPPRQVCPKRTGPQKGLGVKS